MRRTLLAGLALVLVLPASALAHASLSGQTPGFRERLERPPTRVVLHFSQVIQSIPGGIVVRDEAGHVVSDPAVLGSDRRSLVASLKPLARGAYAVRWQTLSVSDGHIVSGLYTFGVGVNAPPPTEAVGASGPSTIEKLVRWAAYLGLAATLGGLAFRLIALPHRLPRAAEHAFLLLTGAGMLVTINAGIAGLLLRADAALQLPFDRFLYADLSPFAGGTRFGNAWVWLTLGAACVIALLTLAWLRATRAPLPLALVIALAMASGYALSGHSASEPNSSWLTVAVDWVHLVAASAWIGGVIALPLVAWTLPPDARRTAFMRFSRVAGPLVAAVVGAGVVLGFLRLPAASDLWATTYGQILVVKAALVCCALGWGAVHRLIVGPRLARDPRRESRGVRHSLLGESTVGVAVFLVAAFLVNTNPPKEAGSPPGAAVGLQASRPSTAAP